MPNINTDNRVVPMSQIRPNTFNPKDGIESGENEKQYRRVIKSFTTHGQIDPLLVRETGPDVFEIINGMHRYKAAQDLGWTELEIKNLGKVSDGRAKALALATEDAKIPLNKILASKLVALILAEDPLIQEDLPYDDADLKAMKELAEFDWGESEGDDGEDKEDKDKPYSIVLPDSHVTDWNQLKTAKGFQYDTELLVWLIENAGL